jgi:hypothetical protein
MEYIPRNLYKKDLHSNLMQIFAHTLHLIKLATQPKFSSKSLIDFELQQNEVKLNLNFNSKSLNQNYVHAFQKL